MTRFASLPLTLSLACLPASLSAQTVQPLALDYATFEAAVPHLDLEQCPAELAGDGRFCRATFNHDEMHVFAFDEHGDVLLVAFRSWPLLGLEQMLK
jgi:hypothetical protein